MDSSAEEIEIHIENHRATSTAAIHSTFSSSGTIATSPPIASSSSSSSSSALRSTSSPISFQQPAFVRQLAILTNQVPADFESVLSFHPVRETSINEFQSNFFKEFGNPSFSTGSMILLMEMTGTKEITRLNLNQVRDLGRLHQFWESHRSLSEISTLDFNEQMFWIDVQNPSEFDIHVIGEALGIHPLTIEDIMVDTAQEKIEVYDNYMYINAIEKDYLPNTNTIRKVHINVLLFERLVLTIHLQPFQSLIPVMYRVRHNHIHSLEKVVCQPAWVMYSVLDVIVDAYFNHVQRLEKDVTSLDHKIRSVQIENHPSYLSSIATARASLVEVMSELFIKQELLMKLTSSNRTLFLNLKSQEARTIKTYLGDVLDHILVMNQRVEMVSALLDSVISNYHGHIGFQASEKSHDMNKTMKRFAAVATIFLPLTFVSSLWGMNVTVPGQYWPGGLTWFFLILAALVLYSVLIVIFFRVKRWL